MGAVTARRIIRNGQQQQVTERLSAMVAAGFGADNMVSLSGASMSGTLNLQGTPPLVMPSGAAAGYVLTTDGSGNVSPQPAVAVAALVPSATVYTSAHRSEERRVGKKGRCR